MIVLGEASSQQVARKLLDFFFQFLVNLAAIVVNLGSCWRPSLPKLLGAKVCHGSAPFLI